MANPSKVDLVGVGLNATDTVIPLSTYPARGSKTEYSTVSTLPGGQVATTVVACQHWGLRTRYVGKLGDDLAATLHREAFSHAGRNRCRHPHHHRPRRPQRPVPHPRRRPGRTHRPHPS